MHVSPDSGSGIEADGDLLRVGRRGDAVEPVEPLLPPARLAAALRGVVPPDEVLLLLDEHPLLLVLPLLLEAPQFLKLGVLGVVARILRDAPAFEVEHLPDGAVEEEAVVRHDQRGAAELLLEIGFQPLDAGEVEVVGGLVEEEQVGLAEEKAREGEARALAAAEDGDGAGEFLAAEAQAHQHRGSAVLALVAAGVLEPVLEPAELPEKVLAPVRVRRRRARARSRASGLPPPGGRRRRTARRRACSRRSAGRVPVP